MSVPDEILNGATFGLIADAHIHPGRTPDLPGAVLEAFRGTDGIIALGDMGEAAWLDALEQIAPVLAVRGADDADDPRIGAECRLFRHGKLALGAVFDGSRHGLYRDNDPLVTADRFANATQRAFGRPLQVLLSAASHKPLTTWCEGILIVNPGSPTLADECTVARLHLADDRVSVRHVTVSGG